MPDSSPDKGLNPPASQSSWPPSPDETTSHLDEHRIGNKVSERTKLAANVVLAIVAIVATIIAILMVVPQIVEVAEEDDLGVVYLSVLRVNLLHYVVIIVDLLLGGVILGALWHDDLAKIRKRIFWTSVAGLVLAAGLYFEFMVDEEVVQNLSQGEGPPGIEEVTAYINSFVWGSAVLFGIILLGILGANYKDFLKALLGVR